MAQIKGEVEAVIKEGRRQAEASPDLTPKVDAIKELYNRLGGEVTLRKTRLEAAAKIVRSIDQDLEDLQAWAAHLDQQIKDHVENPHVLKVKTRKKRHIRSRM